MSKSKTIDILFGLEKKIIGLVFKWRYQIYLYLFLLGLLFMVSSMPFVNLLFSKTIFVFILFMLFLVIFNLHLRYLIWISILFTLTALIFVLVDEQAVAEVLGNYLYAMIVYITFRTLLDIK